MDHSNTILYINLSVIYIAKTIEPLLKILTLHKQTIGYFWKRQKNPRRDPEQSSCCSYFAFQLAFRSEF